MGSVTHVTATATTLRPRLIATAAALLFVITSVWAGPASASVDDNPLGNFTQAERDLLESGEQATLTVDPTTGDFVAIDAAPSQVQPFGVVPNCSGDRACWQGYLSPHLWYGFDGTGASGTWHNRGNFKSNNYRAKLCWSYAGNNPCMSGFSGLNQTITFGTEVTGKSVELTR